MPRAKDVEGRSPVYLGIREAAAALNETNDCAVVSASIATGVSYEKMHALMAEFGRKARRGTPMDITEKTLRALGFHYRTVSPSQFIAQYPGAHANVLRSVTTHHPARFNKVWADGNTYLLRTRSHILCVVNGTNHDWTKGKALRVFQILQVSRVLFPEVAPAQPSRREEWTVRARDAQGCVDVVPVVVTGERDSVGGFWWTAHARGYGWSRRSATANGAVGALMKQCRMDWASTVGVVK